LYSKLYTPLYHRLPWRDVMAPQHYRFIHMASHAIRLPGERRCGAWRSTTQVKTLADSMQYVRAILADDHAVVRAGIAHALREQFSVVIIGEAGDGITLLAMLAATHPDLLITDVTMPNFEPISAIPEIHVRFPTMKILVLSTATTNVDVLGLLQAGVINGYYLKDQPLDDLCQAVQDVLAGTRWVSNRMAMRLIQARAAFTPETPLPNRQRDMLRFLQEGLDNQAIARRTGLTVKTVETYLTHLYRRLNVRNRLEAATYARRSGASSANTPRGR
jgi:DNA-binding NarL/FixJ family response regulator